MMISVEELQSKLTTLREIPLADITFNNSKGSEANQKNTDIQWFIALSISRAIRLDKRDKLDSSIDSERPCRNEGLIKKLEDERAQHCVEIDLLFKAIDIIGKRSLARQEKSKGTEINIREEALAIWRNDNCYSEFEKVWNNPENSISINQYLTQYINEFYKKATNCRQQYEQNKQTHKYQPLISNTCYVILGICIATAGMLLAASAALIPLFPLMLTVTGPLFILSALTMLSVGVLTFVMHVRQQQHKTSLGDDLDSAFHNLVEALNIQKALSNEIEEVCSSASECSPSPQHSNSALI